jgi:LmbE family N-acetylglucosaminyl deacetylase
MSEKLKLMCILAHPDDESMGNGGILARYSAEGEETTLVTATRGEQGWFGDPDSYPGARELGHIRETELQEAGKVLGLHEIVLLDYKDGELDQAEPAEVIDKLVVQIRRVRPQVIVTFGPNGIYGHPDHIAISQFTTAAVTKAATCENGHTPSYPPHQVSKLYYMAPTQKVLQSYQKAFGDLVMHIDGVQREAIPWQDWAVTTRIDTSAYWKQVWEAIACHCSQLPGYQALLDLPEEYLQDLWHDQTLYRAQSVINGGRKIEEDLFAGLR